MGFLVDPRGKVPVKVVARTFASGKITPSVTVLYCKNNTTLICCFLFFISGKTEKLVYQILSDLGLPSGKNDVIEKADFTFEKFYELYHKICPRNDIEELFRSM